MLYGKRFIKSQENNDGTHSIRIEICFRIMDNAVMSFEPF